MIAPIPDDEHRPSVARTHALLEICLGAPAPMVEAARRAIGVGGDEWWDETLARVGTSLGQRAPTHGAGVDLDELERWKTEAKAWTLRSDPPDAATRGTATYLLVTAIAVRDGGRSISSRPASELGPAWLDLADVAPEPWATLFAQAALAFDEA